jgi:hypothetical protein
VADGSLVVLGGTQELGVQWPPGFFAGTLSAEGDVVGFDDYALLEGLRWACATYARGRIYVTGGNDLDSAAGDVIRYATFTSGAGLGPWSTSAGPSPRLGHGCAEHEGFLYLVGGQAGHDSGPPTAEVSQARLRDDGSIEPFVGAPPLPSARRFLEAVVVGVPVDPEAR